MPVLNDAHLLGTRDGAVMHTHPELPPQLLSSFQAHPRNVCSLPFCRTPPYLCIPLLVHNPPLLVHNPPVAAASAA